PTRGSRPPASPAANDQGDAGARAPLPPVSPLPSPLELGQLRPREGQRRLVLDRPLEHLHGLRLVALLRADLAEVIEHLALRDPDVRLETLEEQRTERLLCPIEVVRLEGEDPQILQDADGARIDLEGHVELRQRDVLVAELSERARELVVIERKLLRAPASERRDDPLEHLRGLAASLRRVVGVAEREEQIAIVGDELRS